MSCARWQARIAALDETAEIEQHLARCPDCAELKRELDETRAVLRGLVEFEPADSELEAVRRGVLERVSAPRRRSAWFTWVPAFAGASALAMVLAVWLWMPPEIGPPPVVRFPAREEPVQVARAPARPPRPKRARPAPSRVVIESVREMRDEEGGPPTQLVRLRSQDPRVVMYWVLETEGDQ
jgi:hypothetical protein